MADMPWPPRKPKPPMSRLTVACSRCLTRMFWPSPPRGAASPPRKLPSTAPSTSARSYSFLQRIARWRPCPSTWPANASLSRLRGRALSVDRGQGASAQRGSAAVGYVMRGRFLFLRWQKQPRVYGRVYGGDGEKKREHACFICSYCPSVVGPPVNLRFFSRGFTCQSKVVGSFLVTDNFQFLRSFMVQMCTCHHPLESVANHSFNLGC